MTNQEILEKACRIAIMNGWNPPFTLNELYEDDNGTWIINEYLEVESQNYNCETNTLIYNHDFAKALWGNKRINAERHIEANGYAPMNLLEPVPAWQYNLQQMVVADDPIKYLGEHI